MPLHLKLELMAKAFQKQYGLAVHCQIQLLVEHLNVMQRKQRVYANQNSIQFKVKYITSESKPTVPEYDFCHFTVELSGSVSRIWSLDYKNTFCSSMCIARLEPMLGNTNISDPREYFSYHSSLSPNRGSHSGTILHVCHDTPHMHFAFNFSLQIYLQQCYMVCSS